MQVDKIKTEGTRIDPIRNVERLWLKVTAVGNGCSVEGKNVAGVEPDPTTGEMVPIPTTIEIYADRLPAVLERVRTEAHRAIYERAVESAKVMTEHWIREKGSAFANMLKHKSPEERARIIHMQCNHRPEHELIRMGYRTGLPPLTSCVVVNPKTGAEIDARKFAEYDADKQREWMVDAPSTPHNAAQQASEAMARSIAQAIKMASEDRPRREK